MGHKLLRVEASCTSAHVCLLQDAIMSLAQFKKAKHLLPMLPEKAVADILRLQFSASILQVSYTSMQSLDRHTKKRSSARLPFKTGMRKAGQSPMSAYRHLCTDQHLGDTTGNSGPSFWQYNLCGSHPLMGHHFRI